MERNKLKFLFDIKTSLDSIDEYLEGKLDFNIYQNSKLLRRSVERELIIIGEAVSNLLKLDSDFPLTDARKIVDFRNIMVHSYDTVDDRIVWSIICKNLPPLKNDVQRLLGISNKKQSTKICE